MATKANGIPAENTYYQILCKQSGKAIEAADTECIYMNVPGRGKRQQFSFVPAEGGYYKIIGRETGKALDIILAGCENGAQIHQWEVTGADNQLWTLEPGDKGCFFIKSKASGRCLDIVGMSMEDGARIQIWDDMRGDNQQWMLREVKAPGPRKSAVKKAPGKKAAAKS